MKKLFSIISILMLTLSMGFISCSKDDKSVIKVTSITLANTTTEVNIGGVVTLTATVTPDDATDKIIIWASSNEKVATVDQKGNVKGVAAGKATITATANDGSGVSANCTVTVKATIKTINGHEYVELAGYKWATENVGHVDGVKADAYDPYRGNFFYNYDNSKLAAEIWGDTWTLPTKEQWQALMYNCNWTWQNAGDGKAAGFIVSDRGDASKFIFLPAAGWSPDGGIRDVETIGNYWSSTPFEGGSSWFFEFNFCYEYYMDNGYNHTGMSVRLVSE